MILKKQNLYYSGKVKTLYTTEQDSLLIMKFRDDITAFNGIKHEQLPGKGAINNQINAFLMTALNKAGIRTHFEYLNSENQSVIKRLNMMPIKANIHNIAAGRLCRHLGINLGKKLMPPLYELFLKSDELRDPLVSDYHALSLGWATQNQLDQMSELSFAVNKVLSEIFSESGLILVDTKLEFGLLGEEIYLADELSPDTCRIWDAITHETLDKDRFRQDLGGVMTAYQQVAKRLNVSIGEVPKRS